VGSSTASGTGGAGGTTSAGGSNSGTSGGSHAPDGGYYNLGMNMPSINYYNNTPIYADVTLQMSGNNGPWDSQADSSVAAPLDATGAPTIAASAGWTADYPSGQYALTWDGTGSFDFQSGQKLGTVTSTTSNGVQHNSATLTVTQGATTVSNPDSPPWNAVKVTPPVTNIHLMVPTALQSSDGLFLQPFLDQLRPFSTARFMWALNVINLYNGPSVVNWSQRTWPSSGSRGGTPQGMAYEDIIAFANTGKDVWINVPNWATDDYVCRMARLFHYGEPGDMSNSACSTTAASSAPAGAVAINANSKIYLEYSNELWNWDYSVTADLDCMANGVAPPGHTCTILPDGGNTETLSDGGVIVVPTSAIALAALDDPSLPWTSYASNQYYRGTEMGLVLTKRDNDIFKAVFGGAASQIQTVYNTQSGYAAEADPGFVFMVAAYGSVTGSVDDMAVAPYFNIQSDTADAGAGCYDCSLDSIFQDFSNTILNPDAGSNGSSIESYLQQDVTEAKKYGLPIVAYEGGQGLSGSNPLLITAQFDPRMYAATQQYFQLWDQLIGRDRLFNYFTFTGACGTFGCWGALLNGLDPGLQKWDALMPLTRPLGDANLDGVVNSLDCTILQANYGQPGMWWEQGDFNHDGTVNATDLAIMNANISGAQCTAP
jgi:hypothetical protein